MGPIFSFIASIGVGCCLKDQSTLMVWEKIPNWSNLLFSFYWLIYLRYKSSIEDWLIYWKIYICWLIYWRLLLYCDWYIILIYVEYWYILNADIYCVENWYALKTDVCYLKTIAADWSYDHTLHEKIVGCRLKPWYDAAAS